jgi:microcystin-dependent protein
VAFNGSGTFNRVHNWVTDKSNVVPVTASRMDAEMDGMATGLTTAICRDGQSTTTARIPFAAGIGMSDGSVSTPAINFTGDANSGIYVIGPDNIGVAAAGSKVLDIATTGLTVTGDITASDDLAATDDITAGGDITATGSVDGAVIKQGTYRLVPAGAIMDYAGATAPDGWLLCYGQSLSRATYADLFTAISTTYGDGDDPGNTFAAPDIRGRVVAGQDDMGGSSANRLTDQSGGLNGDTLGTTGGAETHTLSLAESAAHDHGGTIYNDSHTHPYTRYDSLGTVQSGANVPNVWISTSTQETDGEPIQVTVPSAGGGDPHNNVQPTIILNKIIKT